MYNTYVGKGTLAKIGHVAAVQATWMWDPCSSIFLDHPVSKWNNLVPRGKPFRLAEVVTNNVAAAASANNAIAAAAAAAAEAWGEPERFQRGTNRWKYGRTAEQDRAR